jgi:peptide/nickel transport system substrate-binding protein
MEMMLNLRVVATASALLIGLSGSGTAFAQNQGGILKMYVWDSPPSVSILDGPNPIGQRTIAPVFNNLVMFDQHVKQNNLASIVLIEHELPRSIFGNRLH